MPTLSYSAFFCTQAPASHTSHSVALTFLSYLYLEYSSTASRISETISTIANGKIESNGYNGEMVGMDWITAVARKYRFARRLNCEISASGRNNTTEYFVVEIRLEGQRRGDRGCTVSGADFALHKFIIYQMKLIKGLGKLIRSIDILDLARRLPPHQISFPVSIQKPAMGSQIQILFFRISQGMTERSKRAASKAKPKDDDDFVEKEPKGRKKVKKEDFSNLSDIANILRIDSVLSTNVSKTGHPTTCASIADVFAVLFFHESGLHLHSDNPSHFLNDRLVLSKGHAAPILYAALSKLKIITPEDLMSLRLKDSIIEGHPTPRIPFVDVATGSLGQGLGVAAGMAYSSKFFDKIDNRVFCIMGDGEIAEGSVWEAANFGSFYQLDNLIAIVDVNRLGQSDPTMQEHDINAIAKKWEAFGWHATKIDGHNFENIIKGFNDARNAKGRPTVLLAKTLKGKGLGDKIENQLDWHGKPLGGETEASIKVLESHIKNKTPDYHNTAPTGNPPDELVGHVQVKPSYEPGTKISTRKAYGNALVKAYESKKSVVALDGDTKNSTFSITLKNKYPDAFVECYIAEQNMVSVGTGLGCRRKIPFCATFGAFLARAADQIRIAGISQSNLKLVGSHAGCSIGEDGPSQMALEDIAFFRTIPNGVVLYPSDGVSAERAVELAANYKGVVYIRNSRPDVNLLYPNDASFEIGKSKIIKQSADDKLLVIGGGITVHEALLAAEMLQGEGIYVRVMDIFSIKPLDVDGLVKNGHECKNNILTVEDHYPEGGIHEAVTSTVSSKGIQVHRLSVERIPGSAKPEEQLAIHHIDRKSIYAKAKEILGLH